MGYGIVNERGGVLRLRPTVWLPRSSTSCVFLFVKRKSDRGKRGLDELIQATTQVRPRLQPIVPR